MRQFQFGDTFVVTYPGGGHRLASFVVARNDAGLPYLISYNPNTDAFAARGRPCMTQGDRFLCADVPFKVDEDWCLSVGEVTGKERSAIIPKQA